jgi:hypothetical protein
MVTGMNRELNISLQANTAATMTEIILRSKNRYCISRKERDDDDDDDDDDDFVPVLPSSMPVLFLCFVPQDHTGSNIAQLDIQTAYTNCMEVSRANFSDVRLQVLTAVTADRGLLARDTTALHDKVSHPGRTES